MKGLTIMNDLSKPLMLRKVSLTKEPIEYALLTKTIMNDLIIMNDLSKPLMLRKVNLT